MDKDTLKMFSQIVGYNQIKIPFTLIGILWEKKKNNSFGSLP